MGDSDDDWEAIADRLEAAEKCAQAARATEATAAPKAAASHAHAPYKDKKTHLRSQPDDTSSLDDPILEKRRRQKIVEEQESQLFEDLLGGTDIPDEELQAACTRRASQRRTSTSTAAPLGAFDFWESVQLKDQKECASFAQKLVERVKLSKAKSAVWFAFVTTLIENVLHKMNPKDLRSLQTKLSKAIDAQCAKEQWRLDSARKVAGSKQRQVRNYKDEMDIMYGELSRSEGEGEEEYDEEEYYADEEGGPQPLQPKAEKQSPVCEAKGAAGLSGGVGVGAGAAKATDLRDPEAPAISSTVREAEYYDDSDDSDDDGFM